MPYTIRGKCIYRKDTGKKVGCTKGSVQKYLAALQINAEANDPEITELKEIIEKLYKRNDKMKLKNNSRLIKEASAQEYFGVTFFAKYPNDVTNLRTVTASNPRDAMWKYAKRGFSESEIEQLKNDIWIVQESPKVVFIVTTGNYTGKQMVKLLKSRKDYFEGKNTMKLTNIIKEFKVPGNKSSKNAFGDDKTKDLNSNPDDCCKDYPLSYEDAMEKLKGIKDKEKLDRAYEEAFAQMDVPHERNMLRTFYKSLRDGLSQKV